MGIFSHGKNRTKDLSADELFSAAEQAYEKKDYRKAAELYRKAADLGHVLSMTYLAYSYRFGDGVREDANEALKWYQRAYQNGYRKAAGSIGAMYHYNEVSGADNDEIEELLLEGAAYDSDKAYIPLVERYYFPKYGQENSKLAAYWAYRAYMAELPYGSYYMGLFYYNGDFFPKAPAYAKYYLKNFVSLGGDIDVTDMLEDEALKKVTGIKPTLKPFGDTLPDDFFDCEDPEALLELGGAMLNGYDADKNPVNQDIDGGMALIRNAAEQGYAKAQTALGLCYEETGKPCPIFADDGSLSIYKSDVKQFLHWLTKAADQGKILALDTLIPLFRDGKGGVKKNRTLADMYSDMRQKITGEPFQDKNKGKAAYPNGYNVITFDNGDVYEGNISEGMFHGQGKYTSHNGVMYEGYFVFNKPKGKGRLYYPNLYTYVGDVDDYDPDGCGTREDVDGTTVCGMFKNGMPNGLVSHYFPNKDIYIGEVSNGNFVGIGVYLTPNGEISAGKFNNECLTYNEVMKYKSSFKRITLDRTEYYGEIAPGYINGQTVECPNGRGERYTDGGYELGIFKNSHLIHGASYFNNILKYGDFDANGDLNGEGMVLFVDNDGLVSYKGTFLESRYHGKGIYTRSDGQSFLAHWDNGIPTHMEKKWAANGSEIGKFAYTGCKEDDGLILSLSRD